MSIYQVKGNTDYRGHKPGEMFEATLDEATERRAIRRGSIELVHKSVPSLIPGSYMLPRECSSTPSR